jgi:Adaptin N terminal region/Coatomer gamma subunit appendage platform subdomain/Coatomer subunit gamma-1 C-terminal appendage platform
MRPTALLSRRPELKETKLCCRGSGSLFTVIFVSFAPAESVFFGVTKLFTSPDGNLRRLVYLFLRHAAEGTDPSSLIIVTQSLVKDMFNETGLYKGNALRVLGAIVDPSMLSQLERYFRQMVVDRDPYVASTALTTSLLLMQRGGAAAQDVISRWANEVNTVLLTSSTGGSSGSSGGYSSKSSSGPMPPGAGSGGAMLGQGSGSQSGSTDMVAFHALALLRSIKKHDRLAVSKVVTTLMKGTVGGSGAPALRSPLGLCLLIRYAVSLHTADAGVISAQQLGDFLEACMRSCAHKPGSEMAAFEAAKAMVTTLASTSAGRDLTPAVSLLHIFLSSPKGALRFAAVRTLHALAATHPSLVARHCADDLEALIADGNKAVATLAITTLLKTGADAASQSAASGGVAGNASVERLIKQIGPFMSEQGMSDELKCTVISAVHDLALRVPSKHRSLMAFLANALREEGGFDFKKAILDALFDIIESIPESTSEGLLHCCEFIEDCEYSSLASRVLHLLGDKGPATASPGSFVRYIYNRVILESAPVRASAVTALAKFAARVEDLRPSILPLLARCVDDDDDEVRDRATTYLALFEGATTSHGPRDGQPLPDIATLVAMASSAASAAAAAKQQQALQAQQGGDAVANKPASIPGVPTFDVQLTRALVAGRLPLPVSSLSKALTLYAMRPSQGAFSFDALPHVEVPAHHQQAAAAIAAAAAASLSSATAASGEDGASGSTAGGAAASAIAPVSGYGYSSEIRAAEAMAAASKVAKARAIRAADSQAAVNAAAAAAAAGGAAGGAGDKAGGDKADKAAAAGESTAEQLYKVKEFASFGPLFRSSRPISLTEAECEYLVSAQKHLFSDGRHIVIQFSLRNTVPEIQLERASVTVQVSDPSCYAHVVTIAAPKVKEGAPAPAVCYVALARNPDAGAAPSVTLNCELRFASREIDPSTGEALGDATPETFPLDSLDITPADFVAPTPVADFRGSWEGCGSGGEVIEQYALGFKTISDALTALGDTLGMAFCDGSGPAHVKPGATSHAAYLSGTFLGGMKVLARTQMKLSTSAAGGGDEGQQVASGVIVKIGNC